MADEIADALLGARSEPRQGEPARMGTLRDQIHQASRELHQRRQACYVAMMRCLGLEGDMGALVAGCREGNEVWAIAVMAAAEFASLVVVRPRPC